MSFYDKLFNWSQSFLAPPMVNIYYFEFQIDKNGKLILDMTFGPGSNSLKILNTASSQNVPVKIVASTLNDSEYQRSQEIAFEDSRIALLPTKLS